MSGSTIWGSTKTTEQPPSSLLLQDVLDTCVFLFIMFSWIFLFFRIWYFREFGFWLCLCVGFSSSNDIQLISEKPSREMQIVIAVSLPLRSPGQPPISTSTFSGVGGVLPGFLSHLFSMVATASQSRAPGLLRWPSFYPPHLCQWCLPKANISRCHWPLSLTHYRPNKTNPRCFSFFLMQQTPMMLQLRIYFHPHPQILLNC